MDLERTNSEKSAKKVEDVEAENAERENKEEGKAEVLAEQTESAAATEEQCDEEPAENIFLKVLGPNETDNSIDINKLRKELEQMKIRDGLQTETARKPNKGIDIEDITTLMSTLDWITGFSSSDDENNNEGCINDDVNTASAQRKSVLNPFTVQALMADSAKENTARKLRDESPIIPDFDIDYDNIFDDVGKLSIVEKHLELLFRPFICAMDVNYEFNLFELCILLSDSCYDPDSHPALSMCLNNPHAVVKIYANGKMTSESLTASGARISLLKVLQILQDFDYKAELKHFSHNIVHASFCMPFKIDLLKLTEAYADQVSSNREARPFVTFKLPDNPIRFALFPNGFVLVLHSSKHSETRVAIAELLPILNQFRNGYPTPSEKYGLQCGDISYKLLWERKLDADKMGILLYS
ncbi:uncharacterized protein LOC115630523 [Scaptodrosophila lebanonensis]|uniref:Uncharacterized protein LOC115630523 n=1 Tax=Drosophila lebanonensis TaxID=7225 RepID=A0A6J2U737_DROLE|nr:uncharacterized protein LOC115630523 [Scaptodrosophila lebanonensis]